MRVPRPSAAMVVAVAALVLALGGTAMAATATHVIIQSGFNTNKAA